MIKVDYKNKVDVSTAPVVDSLGNPVTKTLYEYKYNALNSKWEATNKRVGERGIGTIYVTGAGIVMYPISGISRDSALGWEEPVWGSELKRSSNFMLSNIDTARFGLVPRVEVDYKYMNIADYTILMKLSKERYIYVTWFNRETGKWVYNTEMAFTGNSIQSLYAFNRDYIGVLGVKIKLVATNREQINKLSQSFTVNINANGGIFDTDNVDSDYSYSTSGSVTEINQDVKYSKTITLPLSSAITPPTGKTFAYWSLKADGTGGYYEPGTDVTVFDNYTFYAMYN